MNARSLVKNLENIETMLQANEVVFSVLGVSVTWLNENHDKSVFSIAGYDAYFTDRNDKQDCPRTVCHNLH